MRTHKQRSTNTHTNTHTPQARFEEAFAQQYAIIHRLETNKLRNVAKMFAHLMAQARGRGGGLGGRVWMRTWMRVGSAGLALAPGPRSTTRADVCAPFTVAQDAISWGVLECVQLTEDDTTSSSRIFLKYLFQVRGVGQIGVLLPTGGESRQGGRGKWGGGEEGRRGRTVWSGGATSRQPH